MVRGSGSKNHKRKNKKAKKNTNKLHKQKIPYFLIKKNHTILKMMWFIYFILTNKLIKLIH